MKKLILVIEDTDKVRDQIAGILTLPTVAKELSRFLENYSVETAGHMAGARKLYDRVNDQAALIVMDVMLPETEEKHGIVM